MHRQLDYLDGRSARMLRDVVGEFIRDQQRIIVPYIQLHAGLSLVLLPTQTSAS